MLKPIATYNGPLQNFSFQAQGDGLVAEVAEKDGTVPPKFLEVHFPPEASTTLKKVPPAVVLDRMLNNGYYPYIRDNQLIFKPGLAGGNPTYIARDWSKPVKETATWTDQTSSIGSLFKLRDGTLASCSDNGTIKLWDKKGECLQTFEGHKDKVYILTELKDETLASGSADKTIKLWDRKTRGCLLTLSNYVPHAQIVELSSGLLASFYSGGWIKFHDRNANCMKVILADRNSRGISGFNLVELQEGKLASLGFDRKVKIWDSKGKWMRSIEPDFRYLYGYGDAFEGFIVLKDGTIATYSMNNKVDLWDVNGQGRRTYGGIPVSIHCLAELQSGNFLIHSLYSNDIHLLDRENERLRILNGHKGSITTVIELRDGTLASGSEDMTIMLWNKEDKCVRVLEGHTSAIQTLLELDDGTLVSLSKDGTIKLWEGELLNTTMSPCESKATSNTETFPKILLDSIAVTRSLLDTYRELSQYDAEYVQQITDRLSEHEKHYTTHPQDSRLQETLAELKEIEDKLRSLLQSSLSSAPIIQETSHQVADRTQSPLLQQQDAFEVKLEERQIQIASEITTKQKMLFEKAVEEALQGASLNTVTETQLQHVQRTLKDMIDPQLEREVNRILESQQSQVQLQALQRALLDEMDLRQKQITQELIHTQSEQQRIKDRQSDLYKAYENKQKRLQEQQALQSPPSVLAFYNTTEKHLSSKLMSAMMLVSGMLVREQTKIEKGGKVTAKVVETLCGAIPVVGSVVGSILSFGIEAGVGIAVSDSQSHKNDNVFASTVRFKDAMAIAELAARKIAQEYLQHIETLSVAEATLDGEKAAELMYRYMQEGNLKPFAHLPIDEKIAILVKVVGEEGGKKKAFFKKSGGTLLPTALPQISRATNHHVKVVTDKVGGLEQQLNALNAFTQIRFTQVTQIYTPTDREKAVAALRVKQNFVSSGFEVKREGSVLTIHHASRDILKAISSQLTTVFSEAVITNSKTEIDHLRIKMRSDDVAEDLELVLNEWLKCK